MGFTIEKFEPVPDRVYRDVTCDGCNRPLKPVDADSVNEDGSFNHLQLDNVLEIQLDGGYGMFIDPFNEVSKEELTILFCQECAIKLCFQWPVFFEKVKTCIGSNIGHECSKLKTFVFGSYDCDTHCPKCKRHICYHTGDRENLEDKYSRQIGNCRKCVYTGPVLWGWELTPEDHETAKQLDIKDNPLDENGNWVEPVDV